MMMNRLSTTPGVNPVSNGLRNPASYSSAVCAGAFSRSDRSGISAGKQGPRHICGLYAANDGRQISPVLLRHENRCDQTNRLEIENPLTEHRSNDHVTVIFLGQTENARTTQGRRFAGSCCDRSGIALLTAFLPVPPPAALRVTLSPVRSPRTGTCLSSFSGCLSGQSPLPAFYRRCSGGMSLHQAHASAATALRQQCRDLSSSLVLRLTTASRFLISSITRVRVMFTLLRSLWRPFVSRSGGRLFSESGFQSALCIFLTSSCCCNGMQTLTAERCLKRIPVLFPFHFDTPSISFGRFLCRDRPFSWSSIMRIIFISTLMFLFLGLAIGQEAAQVRRGADAQQFVERAFQGYQMFTEKLGNCVPPKSSSPVCKNEPFDRSKLKKHQWPAQQTNKDGDKCDQGEYIDPDQDNCMAGGWCRCDSAT